MKSASLTQILFAAFGRFIVLCLLFHLFGGFLAGFFASLFAASPSESGVVTGLRGALAFAQSFGWLPTFLAGACTGFLLRRALRPRLVRAAGLVLLISMSMGAAPSWASVPERALVAIEQGRHAEALRLLEEEPETILSLRLRAICLMELRRDAEAERLLRRALAKEPRHVACRFYLAQALAQQGRIAPALEILRELSTAPEAAGSDYAGQAAELTPQLATLLPASEGVPVAGSERAKRWRALLQAAFEYDDNPAEIADFIPAGGAKNGSFRFTSGAYFDFHFLDQQLDSTPLTLGAAYNFYGSAHFREAASPYDLLHHTGEVFLRRHQNLGPYSAIFGLASGYTYDELGGQRFADTVHLTGQADVTWNRWTATALFLSAEWADFDEELANPALFSRDGFILSPRLRQYFFLADGRWTIWVEYRYGDSDPTGTQFVEQSHQGAIGSDVDLIWSWRWHLGYTFRHSRYPDFLPQPEREDSVHTLTTALSRPLFTERLRAEFRYTRVMSDSNTAFADYTRNICSLGVRYEF